MNACAFDAFKLFLELDQERPRFDGFLSEPLV
jgi:hypothetical protein